jgi:hypothetical protein
VAVSSRMHAVLAPRVQSVGGSGGGRESVRVGVGVSKSGSGWESGETSSERVYVYGDVSVSANGDEQLSVPWTGGRELSLGLSTSGGVSGGGEGAVWLECVFGGRTHVRAAVVDGGRRVTCVSPTVRGGPQWRRRVAASGR